MSKSKTKKTMDLTRGGLFKNILLFSLPLMFSNVLQVLFNMSDVAVVGRFAGGGALGAVGSTTTVILLFTGFLIGMCSGVNALIARYIGSDDEEEIKKASQASALICLIAGLLLSALGIALAKPLLLLLDTKPDFLDGAVLYMRLYLLGMPALAVYNYGNGVFSADGDTVKPLVFLAASGVINVLLNLFFVIACRLSVVGVALASIISQYLSAGLILLSLVRCKRPYRLTLRGFKIDAKKVRTILVLGIPAGVQFAIFHAANLFIQAGVNSFDNIMVEGNSAAANADALVYDIMAAFYTACTSFMAQNYGAGKKKRVLRSYFICLLYSFGIGAIIGGGLVLGGEYFLFLFTKDPAVVEAGMKRLTIMGLSYAFSAFMDGTIAASRGLGKTVVPTVLVILGSCVFRIAWVYTVFAYFGTIPSLYLLYIFSWLITAFAEIIYFVVVYKKIFPKKNPLKPAGGDENAA